LASASSQLDDVDEAIVDTQRVVNLAEAVGDQERAQSWTANLAKLLLRLGAQQMATNRLDSAVNTLQRAKDLAIQVADLRDDARCIGNLATIWKMRGKPQLAIELHQTALEIFERIGQRASWGLELSNLENAYLDLGDY
jgi:tetratricopeptide (TPR) repeat protein